MLKTKQFYSIHPYPNLYFTSKKDLLKGVLGWRMRTIFRTMGITPEQLKGKKVLDIGCGTGEKPIYYALHGAIVDALDFSEPSIRIAKERAKKIGVPVNFICQDLFNFNYTPDYDYIFSLGVLHHTNNPYKGFKLISQAVKPGGILTIGLYHRYGRIFTTITRAFFRFLPFSLETKKKIVINMFNYRWKNERVIFDRYLTPYESTHTVSEVIKWFESNGFKVIGIYPKYKLSEFEWLGRKSFFIISGRRIYDSQRF